MLSARGLVGTEESELDSLLHGFQRIIDQGGPAAADCAETTGLIELLDERLATDDGQEKQQFQSFIERNHAVFLTTKTLQGFARLKPHGYAGDYEIIEKIYNFDATIDPAVHRWDVYYQAAPCAAAVRNRAGIALDVAIRIKPSAMASIACGPGLDMAAILSAGVCNDLLLLDNDPNALKRAQANCRPYAEKARIEFERTNVLRWRPDRKFDLIWCSGLADYLSDRVAVALIQRLVANLNPGGALVLGNFAPVRRVQAYMGLIGDWMLIYRKEADLLRLSATACPDGISSRVFSDETGVNLFLEIQSTR